MGRTTVTTAEEAPQIIDAVREDLRAGRPLDREAMGLWLDASKAMVTRIADLEQELIDTSASLRAEVEHQVQAHMDTKAQRDRHAERVLELEDEVSRFRSWQSAATAQLAMADEVVKAQGDRIAALEAENERLRTSLQAVFDWAWEGKPPMQFSAAIHSQCEAALKASAKAEPAEVAP